MERRVLLAVVLSFVILYVFQTLFVPPLPAPAPERTEPDVSAGGRDAPTREIATPPPSPAVDTEPQPEAVTAEAGEREIVVETATVEAVLTNRGGRVLHWRLKDYRDRQGAPVDLVPSGIPADLPRPFSLQVDDPKLTGRLNNAIYRVTGDTGGRVDARRTAATLTFEYEDAAGLHARKEFEFDPSSYKVTFSASVSDGDRTLNPAIAWGPGLSDMGATSGGGSFFTGNYVQRPQAIYNRSGDVERIPAADLTSQPTHEGQFLFAGVDDHFFLAAAVSPGDVELQFRPLTLRDGGDTQRELVAQTIQFREPPQNVTFFVGPKQFDVLQSVDAELVRAIDYGIFAVIIVPMLSTLKWLYGITGNYGFSIILLTILINILMFPFRHKSVVAMRKMQAIQPQMKAIQERYANLKVTDPARQKMNTEIMNLYRERGVNPASGCVPMLMTMPVLIAFYSLLSMSIELRGAPFVGWISDLSVRDPLYIIPALMGISMFWQQRLTPTSADPTQQRIMMIMPVMFTAMMAFSPSGVVLYWFVSNLWAIGQQYFTNWLIGPPEAALAQPPGARRVKNAGTGRTAGAEKRT